MPKPKRQEPKVRPKTFGPLQVSVAVVDRVRAVCEANEWTMKSFVEEAIEPELAKQERLLKKREADRDRRSRGKVRAAARVAARAKGAKKKVK